MLVLIDIGLGNIASVANMIRRLGYQVEIRSHPNGLAESDSYILPGVGAFDEGVVRLRRNGWFDHLRGLPESTHVLGICLGMQLLGQGSEEGDREGLGRIPARFTRFREVPHVPHMGWNLVEPVGESAEVIFDPAATHQRFYFTHSYRAGWDEGTTIGVTEYGARFSAAYQRGRTLGVQFHPEKSHRFGMSLFNRWIGGLDVAT